MKTLKLKMSLPKIAVLSTGLTAAILLATMSPQAAQAYSSPPISACTDCHGAATGTTTATAPSTVAAGASYTVAITLVANSLGGKTGYAILPVAPATGSTAGGGSALSYTATMTAPAGTGTYSYTVWTNQGKPGAAKPSSTTYSITVGAAATTPAATTPAAATPAATPAATTPAATTPAATTPAATNPAATTPAATTPAATNTTAPVVAGVSAVADPSAVIPVGAPNTGAGGASSSTNGSLVGLGGVALLLAGAGATQVVRRRRQV